MAVGYDVVNLTLALAVPGSKLSAAGIESVRSRVANLSDYLDFANVNDFISALQDKVEDGAEYCLSEQQVADIEALASEQFRSWEWIYGHSPSAEFQTSKKFGCGTVTVRYSLKHGRFTEVAFEGDFIGARAVTELAEQMQGLRPEDLSGLPIGKYFDSLTVPEFLSLFS